VNRQKALLFCLLLLLVLVIIWSYARMPRQKKASALKYAPGGRAASTVRSEPGATARGGERIGNARLRLDLLDREAPEFRGYRRDIFKPVFVDEIKMARLKLAAAKSRRSPLHARPVVPVVPAATAKPRLELARFTFLGFLQKDRRKIVFLSRDREIILVRKGDTFAGRYEAASITDQALTIRVKDSGEEIVIPLVEHSSLRPAP